MAEVAGHGIAEKELTCAICTEILYQPLTLLDCLHTFCGACLKEWFKWQATNASHNRRTTSPYTCPSCREPVRRTKADWRLTTLLEGFLKANPDKAKDEQEKAELAKHYTPGEDILPPVPQRADSEDEQLLADVREMSMAGIDPQTARRRADEAAQRRRRREQYSPDELGRRQQPSRWAAQQAQLTESRLRAHDAREPQIEHQPSLRSLLSGSDGGDTQDVQAEILRSIYADGLLDGIDLDNMTTEQEEELTERIAEAYRRRQRQRDRSGNRQSRNREHRSPRSSTLGVDTQSAQSTNRDASTEQQQQSRARPPISRPHLFEQAQLDPPRNHRRSQSATSQRSDQSDNRSDSAAPAARSATDLSQQPTTSNTQRDRHSRLSHSGRSITDPQDGGLREQIHQYRANSSSNARDTSASRPSSSGQRSTEATRRQTLPANQSSTAPTGSRSPPGLAPPQTVRHEVSHSAFAPEAVPGGQTAQLAPVISCSRCNRSSIQYELHYNCRWCLDGNFNLCLQCYRDRKGCYQWFGFGLRAFHPMHGNAAPQNRPMGRNESHILVARKHIKAVDLSPEAKHSEDDVLREGAFCELCFSFANDCYWFCGVCLEGAWGFCDNCVKRGNHCTHPLLAVAHISTVRGSDHDPSKLSFAALPHLKQDSYMQIPLSMDCDQCHRSIPPHHTRYHCNQCNEGDYDICNDCYSGLVSQGKISQADGPSGWRRCLNGHRMIVIDFQPTAEGGRLRRVIRDLVGGRTLKENEQSETPPDERSSLKCLALHNYFPREGVTDELAFPKNAEITEVAIQNADWYSGVYAGNIGLLPSGYVRKL